MYSDHFFTLEEKEWKLKSAMLSVYWWFVKTHPIYSVPCTHFCGPEHEDKKYAGPLGLYADTSQIPH